MKHFILALLLSGGLASGICINAGGPDTGDCGPDQYFTGGAVWGAAQQSGLVLSALRYGLSGAAFSYSIPVAPDFYDVTLTFVEPNKNAPKQRLFTVTLNGQASDTLDVFAVAGTNTALRVGYIAIANTGLIRLEFKATVGNPMISRIEIKPSFRVNTITLNPVLDGMTYRPQVHGEQPQRITETVFVVANLPIEESVQVYVDGLRKAACCDYALRGQRIVFASAIPQDSRVLVDYFYDKPVTDTINP